MDILEQIEKALDIYTAEEIFELNDMTVDEVLLILIQKGIIVLPETLPV